MSDRIDELVDALHWATATCAADHNSNTDLRIPPTDSDRVATRSRMGDALTELATIAREAEARGFGHAQVVRLRDSVRQMLEYIGRHEQFCDAAALVAYNVDEMLRAVIPSTGLQRAFWATDERALKAEAMCAWLAERLEESDDTVLIADTWLASASEAVGGRGALRRPPLDNPNQK